MSPRAMSVTGANYPRSFGQGRQRLRGAVVGRGNRRGDQRHRDPIVTFFHRSLPDVADFRRIGLRWPQAEDYWYGDRVQWAIFAARTINSGPNLLKASACPPSRF